MMDLTPPFLICTDTYKASHERMYPDVKEMTAYMECRGAWSDASDDRIVFSGIRYLYETILNRRITMKDIEEADRWYSTHCTAKSPMYYPREVWLSVVKNNDGYIPLKIEALQEGTVIYPHVPFLQITGKGEYAKLVTWFETLFMHIWSPIVTGTKSRMIWDKFRDAFETSVEEGFYFLLNSRLHDFGFRGVSSLETAMTTGYAHLLSFEGTDTQPAGWLATQFNNGNPVGESVWATEHSVMTAWDTELQGILHTISEAPNGSIVSVVADSYDYHNFLNNILPQVVIPCREKNIFFVIRPDSGNPIQCVEDGLHAAEKCFGATVNRKGYKVINGCAVLQGDGIDYGVACRIIEAVLYLGYSAQNIVLGMGGGLLQKQDRDTLKVAMKLSRIVFADGRVENRMKDPQTDINKVSLPGKFQVREEANGLSVLPAGLIGWADKRREHNELRTIWDSAPVLFEGPNFNIPFEWPTFQQCRDRLNEQWARRPRRFDPISQELKEEIVRLRNLRNSS